MVDDKDWTWVLERTCPECGFAVDTLPRDEIAPTARRVAKQFAVFLGSDDVRQRPSPEVWSTLEYACHIVEIFEVMGGRLRLMLREDDPTFPDWDQDATALERRYDLQDPLAVASEIVVGAEVVAAAFDHVGDDEWQRPGLRSNGSPFTVETLGRYMAHDLVHHVWDIEQAADDGAPA